MSERTEDIVTDEQIEKVHAYANFGDQSKRSVVDEGVLEYAFGYSGGHTQYQILREHGLVRATRSYYSTLTKKGQSYLRAMFVGITLKEILEARSKQGEES